VFRWPSVKRPTFDQAFVAGGPELNAGPTKTTPYGLCPLLSCFFLPAQALQNLAIVEIGGGGGGGAAWGG